MSVKTINVNNDGGINVQDNLVAQVNQLIADLANFRPVSAVFTPSGTVVVGQLITDGNGNLQQVTAATAANGSTTPTWATTLGTTTVSGGVTYTLIGFAPAPVAAQINLTD